VTEQVFIKFSTLKFNGGLVTVFALFFVYGWMDRVVLQGASQVCRHTLKSNKENKCTLFCHSKTNDSFKKCVLYCCFYSGSSRDMAFLL
jgi:hypothetical protein